MGPAIRKRSNDHVDLRISSEVKAMLERTAALVGQSVAVFVMDASVRAAHKAIREAEGTTLPKRDRDRFLAALDQDDAKPNAALRRAAERYKVATR